MIQTDLIEIGNIPERERRAEEYTQKIERKFKIAETVISIIIAIVIGLIFGLCHVRVVNANSLPIQADTVISEEVTVNEETLLKNDFRTLEMTYYTETGNECANGKMPRFGICSYNKDYIGQTAIVYSSSGQLIGYFEIYDTGYGRTSINGKGTIENEECIDIFMESDRDGKEFIKEHGNKCYVKIVNAKG